MNKSFLLAAFLAILAIYQANAGTTQQFEDPIHCILKILGKCLLLQPLLLAGKMYWSLVRTVLTAMPALFVASGIPHLSIWLMCIKYALLEGLFMYI